MDSVAKMVESMLEGEDEAEEVDKGLVPYVQVLQRWKVWRDNVPIFYSTCVLFTTPWPSHTVQLYPHVRRERDADGLLRHAVLYGNRRDSDDMPVVVLATVLVDDNPGHLKQPLSLPTMMPYTEPVEEICSFPHPPGHVDRVRCSPPARPNLVAVKCDGTALSLYDIGPALARIRAGDVEGAAAGDDGDDDVDGEGGGGEDGGDGGCGGRGNGARRTGERGRVGIEGSGGDGDDGGDGDGLVSVLDSEVQEGVSLTWADSGAGGGGGGGGLRLFSGLREAVAAPAMLASAGTDGRTLLWDPRQRQPALQAPRCRRDVNAVAFAPAAAAAAGAGPLLANAGDEGIIRVYDIRMLGGGGGGGSAAGPTAVPAPLHRLTGHNCQVQQLSFSPHLAQLLAAADEQGRVLLWELGRVAHSEEGLATRPELLFAHAGHALPVDDISWSTELYGTLASVSGFIDPAVVAAARSYPGAESDLPQPPAGVQVWRPAGDVLPPPPSKTPTAAKAKAVRPKAPAVPNRNGP
ncbi:hypothetical protein VOLCADRAFT_89205 [Volvox carteri f. nagariensis]|uniref:Histone-binding protein RBBP4-like N-terminal domain-containing protein n=1 Tax=Volvox carteri f. nagariensis TaxID=3068 RepID=D8TR29_VOLCA|nr:uncharacterized protein VOLCADRAFT_89205 [Volvox carteri f. nagariensis]EFJ50129.1 hypothetical protein VOLCADRAFT_89205 [Volvox carteri f. nagariensis]|eukprot:XP_002948749.1 hypothetical protein VOLCADRAFT_89205 [Volvox carteri f. nagariensis]